MYLSTACMHENPLNAGHNIADNDRRAEYSDKPPIQRVSIKYIHIMKTKKKKKKKKKKQKKKAE